MSRGLFMCLLATVAWGVAPLLDKLALKNGVDPFVGLAIRSVTTLLTLVACMAWLGKLPEIPEVPGRTVMWLAASGILSGVVGMAAYFFAMRSMDAGVTVALTSTYPALTMVLCAAFMDERMGPRHWIAVLLIVGGIVLLEWSPSPNQ